MAGPDDMDEQSETPTPRPGRRDVLIAAAAIVLIGAAAWSSAFGGKFFLDDHRNILENPRITRPLLRDGNLWKMVRSDMRPVALLSLAFNYRLGGDSPVGYHAFNVTAHVLSALLLFGIVRRTLLSRRLRARFGAASVYLAAAAAMLWMVHPLQTQAITYVVQRMESLMGLFYLLTMYCAVRALEPGRAGRWWVAAAIAACAAGMGAKQVMVTAPLAVVAYDAVFAGERPAALLKRRWPLYAGLAAGWIVLAVLIGLGPSARGAGFGYEYNSPARYAMTQLAVIARYLRLAVWPTGLCLDYGRPFAETLGDVMPQAIVVTVLLAATVWAMGHYPAWGLLGGWFFLTLAPSSSVMPIADACVEHRMYLPLAGVVAAAVVGAYLVGRRLTRGVGPRERLIVGGVAVGLAVAALSIVTFRRNEMYHDVVGMWRDVVAKAPHHWRGYDSLGHALDELGQYDEAIENRRKSVELNPYYADGHYGLGVTLAKRGKLTEAGQSYLRALRLNPRHVKAYCNLANALRRLGKLKDAEAACRKAIEISPGYAMAHGALGNVLLRQKRYAESIEAYRTVLRLDPWNHGACEELVGAMIEGKRPQDALEFCRQWADARPHAPDPHIWRARALKAGPTRDYPAIIACYRDALAAAPDNAMALNALAWIRAVAVDETLRDPAAALRMARRACEIDGHKTSEFVDTLAAAHAANGRFDEAVRIQQQAIDIISAPEGAAPPADHADMLKAFTSRLRVYEAQRPYRTPNP